MIREPADAGYAERVRASFAAQTIMKTLGAELMRVAPGEIEIVLPFRAELAQQHGFLHAGVVTTLMDSACGWAAYSLMPADAGVLAVEFKVNFLRPAAGDVVARATVLKAVGLSRPASTCRSATTGESRSMPSFRTSWMAR